MTTKSVIKLLEDNRKTMQALLQTTNNDSQQSMMETENDTRPIVEIVEGILEREPWKGQRAAKLDIDDFLQLLSEFNEAGIHFC